MFTGVGGEWGALLGELGTEAELVADAVPAGQAAVEKLVFLPS